jgi:acetyltransferase-like isoleucine patch superfamily enzyme
VSRIHPTADVQTAAVGAGSVVTRDVPPGVIVCGNPAREAGRVPESGR